MNLRFDKLESNLEKDFEKLLSTGYLLAVKAEFEAEGTRIDELVILSELCSSKNIPFTLKIGGPSAQRDFYEAFLLGANNILVPMIESKFALINSYEIFSRYIPLFKELKKSPRLFINLESKLSINNLKSIISLIKERNYKISSVVIGRTDLSSSLNIEDVNSSKILEISKEILKYKDLFDVTVGGNLTSNSFEFIKELTYLGIESFESRKCTFKADKFLNKKQFSEILDIGLEFELSWLNYKKEFYSNRSILDDNRMRVIQNRLNS